MAAALASQAARGLPVRSEQACLPRLRSVTIDSCTGAVTPLLAGDPVPVSAVALEPPASGPAAQVFADRQIKAIGSMRTKRFIDPPIKG